MEQPQDQNSLEWLKWRNEGIGASDAPIIMGKSEFKTKSELWDEKFNKTIKEDALEPGYIQQKGHNLEAWARPGLEFNTGMPWRPALFTHTNFEFIRASLDGWQPDLKEGWECKFMGKDIFEVLSDETKPALKRIPEKYFDQIMQQFFVTGAVAIRLTGIIEFKDEYDHKQKKQYTLIIERNEEVNQYINNILAPELFAFWKSVQDGTRPQTDDKHVLPLKNKEISKLVKKYEKQKEKVDAAKLKVKEYSEKHLKKHADELEELKTKIYEHPSRDHKKMDVNGFKLTVVAGKEIIDYKAAFEAFIGWIKNVKEKSGEYDDIYNRWEFVHDSIINFPDEPSLEKYTKPGKESFRITIPKNKEEKTEPETVKTTETTVTETVKVGDVSKTTETKTVVFMEPGAGKTKTSVKATIEHKKDEWKNATPEQQEIIAKENAFKNPETKKVPKKWADKTRKEKIEYLRKTAKRKETSEHGKNVMLELAAKLESLPIPNIEVVGGVTFEN